MTIARFPSLQTALILFVVFASTLDPEENISAHEQEDRSITENVGLTGLWAGMFCSTRLN